MSEATEKPFDAPPSRIAKARREGNIPRAQEFGSNLAFAAAAMTTAGVCEPVGKLASRAIVQGAAKGQPAQTACALVALSLAPMIAAAIAGVLGNVAQSGGLVVSGVAIKFDRLHPLEGMRRMMSRESATHVVRAFAAFAVAAIAVIPVLRELALSSAVSAPPLAFARIAWRGSLRAAFAALGVGLLFSLAEYAVARRAWLRRLRMSLAELKRELKESDGDPLARSRRRSLHRSLVRGALSKVKEASFIVVNPTHVAVALEYRPPSVRVPTVLVRAAGEMALRVRALAAEHHVPVVANVALARRLYENSRAGEPIAHEHYVAVAEVVAALYRSGALRQ